MKLGLVALSLLLAGANVHAASTAWQPDAGHTQIPLWPGVPPNTPPMPGLETTHSDPNALIGGKPVTSVTNVSQPTMTVYAPKGQNTSLEYYSVIARCEVRLRESTEEVRAHQNQALDKFRPEKDYSPIEDGAASQIVAYRCEIRELSAKKRILADGQYSPPGQPKAPYLRYPFPSGATLSGLGPEAFDPHKFAAR